MNYWLLTTEYPPQFGGGIGTYCKIWADTLNAKGVSVTVFLPNRTVEDYVVKYEDGVRVVEFSPYLKNTASFFGYETTLSYSFAEVIRIFLEIDGIPDWLEAQEYNGIAYFILQRKHLGEAHFESLNVIITCHAPSFLYFEFNHVNTYKLPYFWIGEMERYCIQVADVCISPSQYLVDRLKERFIFEREIHVLPNPFQAKEKAKVKAGDKAVFLAKLSPSKGVLQTLQCFKYLWDAGYDYKLKMIGDKNFFYHAKERVMGKLIKEDYLVYIEKGLLEISGTMGPEKLQYEIAAAKVVLVPSTVDNFPYTVLESMSHKKVVLASKQGGHQEIIINSVNGFLFDHNDREDYSNKILEIFKLKEDQVTLIGENAAKTVKEICNPDVYYDAKINLLQAHISTQQDNSIFKFIRNTPALCVSATEDEVSEKENFLLSVVIPFYNMGKYVDETIKSVLESTYKQIEVIVVNDGSDDPLSLKALEKYKANSKIKIISQRNSGLAETRNRGAVEAKGKFLAFLDADDVVHPEYYSRSIKILQKKKNVHFVGCWVQYFEGANGVWPSLQPEPPYLLYHNMVNSSALVYKKESYLTSGMNDSNFLFGMEDYDSVINLVKNGFNGVVIPDVLFNYRVRKGSMARGFNPQNKAYLYQLLSEKHKGFYSNFASEITNLLNANGPGFQVENPTMDYHLNTIPGYRNKYLKKIYTIIKQHPVMRRVALAAYNQIK